VGAVLEGSRPRPADVRAPSRRSMLNAQIEVPVPLHRDQTRVHECFNAAVRSTRGEPHP
jgi:hypothetical protein